MKCIVENCEKAISNVNWIETVEFEGVEYDVSSAVISADKQLLCCYHERVIMDLASRQRRERYEKEMDR